MPAATLMAGAARRRALCPPYERTRTLMVGTRAALRRSSPWCRGVYQTAIGNNSSGRVTGTIVPTSGRTGENIPAGTNI
ncbi:MAG: hypothetical protein WCE79_17270 [Xanthobacteraceae bacterium]